MIFCVGIETKPPGITWVKATVSSIVMIPPVVHQVWIDPLSNDGDGAIPQDVMENLNSWRETETHINFKLWSLSELAELCRKVGEPQIERALKACRFPAMQADLSRLFLLRQFGGFWVDLKLKLLHRILPFLAHYDLVVTEHFVAPNLPVPNGTLSNSFIGAKPCHPAMERALLSALTNIENRTPNCYWTAGAPNIQAAITGSTDLGSFKLLRHDESWDYIFTIKGGSYNADGYHWSIREKSEPLYFD